MPELPEIESLKRGIEPHLKNRVITKVLVYHASLRQPIPKNLPQKLERQQIISTTRRGKYLLINTTNGTLLIHLGMTGTLKILPANTPLQKHDHFELVFNNDKCLRFNDPRRFGLILWIKNPAKSPFLAKLGIEPLTPGLHFTGKYLFNLAQQRTLPVKSFIMDSHVVVGIGNIYANEALFAAQIHPQRRANQVSSSKYNHLAKAIKKILRQAINEGGTTLRNFVGHDGQAGRYKNLLKVYGKEHAPCPNCHQPLQKTVISQRSTFFCAKCQK